MLKKNDMVLYDMLIEKRLISREILESFVKETETSQSNLAQILAKHGMFPEKEILGVFAEKSGMSFISLRDISVERGIIEKIPVKIAAYYKFMPISLEEKTLTIAVSWPMDIKTQDEIRTQLGYAINPALACEDEILDAMKKYYGFAADTLGKIQTSF